MSWGMSYTHTQDTLIPDAELQKIKALSSEAQEQFAHAVGAVDRLVNSGVVGDPEGTYQVYISCHANPEHKPTEGWANDALSISITQV